MLHDAGAGVSRLRGNLADPLYVLMAVVALVLLIACANVANLLLARATARQFLTESLMLSVTGGGLGSLLAVNGVQILIAMVGGRAGSVILDARPDLRVLAFTIGASLLTGLIFGLAPAWRSARVSVSGTLKEAGRGITGSSAKIGAGKILVIGQIAVFVMLLIGAGWFIRTQRNLENVDLGYQREKLTLVRVNFPSAGYSGERLPIAYDEVRERLARIPGVREVTYSANGLFSGSESADEIGVEGYKTQKAGDLQARFDRVGPNYFATVGISILLGRDIGPQDVESNGIRLRGE